MNAQTSRVLFDSGRYVVCVTSAGLSVQSKRSHTGQLMKPEHAQYGAWVTAFESSYADELENLCRGFLR